MTIMSSNSEIFSYCLGNKPHIIQGTVETETDVSRLSDFPLELVEELLDTTITHHKRSIVECPNIKLDEENESYVGIRGLVVASKINTDEESYRLVINKLHVKVNPNGRKNYNPVKTEEVILGSRYFITPRENLSNAVLDFIQQL